MLVNWNVSPIAFEFGPIVVRWYGLFFLAGFYLGFYFMRWVCKKEGKPVELVDSLLIYSILGTTIGARVAHCLFYEWGYYSQHPLEILMIWRGGLASHGGALGLITGLILFTRKYKEFPTLWMLDRIAVPTSLSAAFIRFGNLMNSEIIGKPTNQDWGFVFSRIDLIPRHPTQIYEAIMYLFVWVGGFLWYRRYKFTPPGGLLFGWVIGIIFTYRIFIELVKENQEAFEANMTLNMGQILSIPFATFGLFLFFRALFKPQTVEAPPAKKNRKK